MEFTKKELHQLRNNSLERVFSTALKCAQYAMNANDQEISELGSISEVDIQDLKELATKLWNNARNETWTK